MPEPHEDSLLTVSLVSHRHGRLAQHVLDDLSRMDGRLARVIVTRNVAEDWTPALRHPSARLVVVDNARPKGFGANHNAAFGDCRSGFFAVLNPDLDFAGANLPDALRVFDDPRVGVASPTIVAIDGKVADFTRDLMSLPNLLRRHLGQRHRPVTIEWIAGMCLVFRSAAFADVGGFDDRYFLYCEDADICGRMKLRGWTLAIDPTLRVVHQEQRLSLRSFKHFAHHVASLVRYWCTPSFRQHRALIAARRRE